jgi:hypothetical protein
MLKAAAACGVQNTPPGSATLALHARVTDLTPAEVDQALTVDKTLVQVWNLRASPYMIPTSDAAVFTTGLLPDDEESLRFFIFGAGPALDQIGVSATEVLKYTARALPEVLDGCELTKDELGIELAQQLSQHLTPKQLAAWQSPSWYASNQRLGESVVRFAVSIVALQGVFCFAPRRRNAATFIRTDQWLGSAFSTMDPLTARAALVRRYLSCYGPSTSAHYAEWAGISPAQADRAWQLVEADLVAVDFGGKQTWLHKADVVRFKSPLEPKGIRFLPPHDPYLFMRDRDTLIPNRELHTRVWRHAGNPGAILANGQIVATWRSQKKGRQLLITADPLVRISKRVRAEIDVEAESLAPYRDCASVKLEFASKSEYLYA